MNNTPPSQHSTPIVDDEENVRQSVHQAALRKPSPWPVIMLAAVVCLAIALAASSFYRHEHRDLLQKHADVLHALASIRVEQVCAWQRLRLRDVQGNASDDCMRQGVADLLSPPSDPDRLRRLARHLATIQATSGYHDVLITSADGRVLISATGQPTTSQETGLAPLAGQAIASGHPLAGELTPCPDCPQALFDVAMAIPNGEQAPLAVLILRTDLRQTLYPLLHDWPIPSTSAETILVRRQGDSALILSPHRGPTEPQPGHGHPLSQTNLPAVQAVLGRIGLFQGQDSRGQQVMADLQPVPDTPWFLVTKIDRQEVMTEVWEHGWFIASLAALSLMLAIGATSLMLSSRQHRLTHSLLLAEQEKGRMEAAARQDAARLAKLNRVYRVLNAINQAIIREDDTQRLFSSACRIAVEEGGFLLAWVGVLDEPSHHILPAASAGRSTGYLKDLAIVLDDSPRGQGPTATAFRSALVVCSNDIRTDPRMAPWREQALSQGYRSSAAFPLSLNGKVVATFNLYSGETDTFNDDELRLLGEMIDNLSYALNFLEVERRQQNAEAELMKLTQAVEQNPVAIVITNRQGDIEYVNQKFLQVTGYAVGEVLGANPRLLKSGETSAADYQRLWQTITQGGTWRGLFHNRKKDGTLFWERATIGPILNAAGEIDHFLAIKEDITDYKAMEEQLAQAQKMETVGRLAGGVAHDFNNMLGVILGSVELALDRVPADDPLRLELGEIRKAAERSARLTRQLLAFARKQVATPQVLCLNETIDGMLTMLRRLLGEDISLVWHPSPELWPVTIDPSQVDQLLANLTVNARDAILQQGTLTIATANLTLSEADCHGSPECRPGDFVRLTVSDSGAGMEPETLAHLFEPFFTTKGLGQGTGLGLATSYGIVHQNQGWITVDSKLGLGSTFRVYLPRTTAPPARDEQATPPPQPPPPTATILLVEDEEAILDLGERILTRCGYQVLRANRPSLALAVAASHPGPLDLLITDIVMPEMNGKELADQLTTTRPGLATIFMSGYTANIIAQQGLLEDEITFLAKPFSREELTAKVRQALTEARARK